MGRDPAAADEKTADMTDGPASESKQEPFEAVLYPNPPLSGAGFAALAGAILFASGGVAALFLMLGAWPVCGFFGLDVALLLGALALARREGRRYEVVRLDTSGLHVRRVDPRGRVRAWRLEPYWTRITLDRTRDQREGILLSSRGIRLIIGTFLTAQERREFARALGAALHRFRALPA